MDPRRFEELVSDALDLIPAELAAAFDNVVGRMHQLAGNAPRLPLRALDDSHSEYAVD